MAGKLPRPVGALKKNERAYEAALRKYYLAPFFRRVRGRLAQAEAANQAWYAMLDAVAAQKALPREGVPIDLIQKHLSRIEESNRAAIIRSFRSALGVNIGRLLTEGPIASIMAERVRENVDLIKTIPQRAHDSLKARVQGLLVDRPFDEKLMFEALRDEYKSSGYNLRRITRDQNSKLVGQLNQTRQEQLQITGYEWITSGDERVRASHRANNGKLYRWDTPPPETGHPGASIQCRCIARALVTAADRARLTAQGT